MQAGQLPFFFPETSWELREEEQQLLVCGKKSLILIRASCSSSAGPSWAFLCLHTYEHTVSNAPFSLQPRPLGALLDAKTQREGGSRGNIFSVHTQIFHSRLAGLCGCWYLSLETLGLDGSWKISQQGNRRATVVCQGCNIWAQWHPLCGFTISKLSYLFLWEFQGSLLFAVGFVFLFCFLTKHLSKGYAFQKRIV